MKQLREENTKLKQTVEDLHKTHYEMQKKM